MIGVNPPSKRMRKGTAVDSVAQPAFAATEAEIRHLRALRLLNDNTHGYITTVVEAFSIDSHFVHKRRTQRLHLVTGGQK